MMQTLKKAKDIAMARIEAAGARGDIVLPSWFVKVAAGIFLVFVAISSAALTSWAQVGQNTKDIANHELRIKALESTPIRISVIETKQDALSEQNRRMEEKIDRLMEMQSGRGGRND